MKDPSILALFLEDDAHADWNASLSKYCCEEEEEEDGSCDASSNASLIPVTVLEPVASPVCGCVGNCWPFDFALLLPDTVPILPCTLRMN